jgi:hypothetical protein
MKPQTIILPLSKPKPKRPDIPDAHVDYLTANCERRTRLLSHAEATKGTDRMLTVQAKPITGWRKLMIKWRLKRQYWAECRAASV